MGLPQIIQVIIWLVVSTPLKNMTVSWDVLIVLYIIEKMKPPTSYCIPLKSIDTLTRGESIQKANGLVQSPITRSGLTPPKRLPSGKLTGRAALGQLVLFGAFCSLGLVLFCSCAMISERCKLWPIV